MSWKKLRKLASMGGIRSFKPIGKNDIAYLYTYILYWQIKQLLICQVGQSCSWLYEKHTWVDRSM